MKEGDLRRFYDDVGSALRRGHELSGRTFMILTTTRGYSTEILVGGQVVGQLSYSWVQDNSEMISESR